jgi:hypothetical protein
MGRYAASESERGRGNLLATSRERMLCNRRANVEENGFAMILEGIEKN